MEAKSLFGKGIYTISEVAALAGLSQATVWAWVRPRRYRDRHGPTVIEPIIACELPRIDSQVFLSFLDLMEVICVKFLKDLGMTMREIALAHERASQVFSHPHPFALEAFLTDGRGLFVSSPDAVDSDIIMQLHTGQLCFPDVIRPYLDTIEFEEGLARRWRPSSDQASVVVDPARSFGEPVIDEVGVQTRTLYLAVRAEKDIKRVADWYEVPVEAVKQAVAFEEKIAA